MSRTRAAAAMVASLSFASIAAAASKEDQQRAEQLFQEAKKEMDAGQFASACPKLVEAERLDPGGGTLLALALCREGEGHDAEALPIFRDARAAAVTAKRDDRVALCDAEVAKIEARVSRITIRLAAGSPAKVVVTLDGEALAADRLGAALPVDGGGHVILAQAAGYKTWSTTIAVASGGDRREVVVPPLEPIAGAQPAVVVAPHESNVVPWILVGAGAAGLAVGTFYGFRALSKASSYKTICPGGVCTDQHGVDVHDQAKSAATYSTIGFAVGGGLAAIGAVMLLVGHGDESKPKVTAVVAPGNLGVSFTSPF